MTYNPRGPQQYDKIAASYAVANDTNVFNSLFERPATIALLGEVSGRMVLDVGCGAGALTDWLLAHGATVVAMDASPRMLDLARQRVGDRAHLVLANLEHPLEFQADQSVDVIVASLVLHYVRDWEAVFSEFRRVLIPDGVVVFSTHHPAMDWQLHSPDDYFAIKEVTETWTIQGEPFEVTFWRRPLTAMTSAISSAGFVIERLVEPLPSSEADQRNADVAHTLRTEPSYLFFRLRARQFTDSPFGHRPIVAATVPSMSPRRPRASGQSRQQIAQRLKDRRSHEERLILEAADALSRRQAAEAAAAEAVDALTAALDELQRHGFELADIAALLEVDPSEISGVGSNRRQGGRPVQA